MWLSSSVKARLLVLGLGLTVIPLSVVMVMTIIQQNKSAGIAGQECKDLNLVSLDRIANSVYALCETQQQVLEDEVTSGLNVTRNALGQLGPVTFADETVTWQAVNQVSNSARTVSLPKMMAGDTWLGQNASAGRRSPVVDDVGSMVGGVSTIFQRMNPEGDMLRVCTNVLKSDGSRALGTYMPATNPDGKPNPVVSKVLKGETFLGRAKVLGVAYVVAYEPLRDGSGQVVGVNCFGVPMESATAMRQAILDITIAETGYVFVVDGKGEYLISQGGKRDGESIWDARDSDGVTFIQEIVAKSTAAPAGTVVEQLYPWKNPGDPKPRLKVARCVYFEPWDWVIGASSYMDEFTAAERRIQAHGRQNSIFMGLIILAAVCAGTVATILISGRITGPLRQAVEVADRVAHGDLSVRLKMDRKDEVGVLSAALDRMSDVLQHQANVASAIADGDLTVQPRVASEDDAFGQALLRMCQRLNEALGGVRLAAVSVSSGSKEISDSSTSLSQGATEQAASLQEITSSLTELSSRVQVNAKNAEQADNLSRQAQESAATGVDQMQSMSGAMSDISQSSEEIAKIIKVIDDIAFQTNLLALNAAVEAARAGKHGKGFAVVAEEVRNLAGRSAKAARETAQLIEGSLGKVERGTAMAADTLSSLQSIVDSVTKASDLVGEIASASSEQAHGLTEISQGLSQIDSVTQQNTANSEETASAAQELSSQATELQGLLARFKLNAKDTGHSRARDVVDEVLDFELEPVESGW